MKKIGLSQGLEALVDDDLFDSLNQWKWTAKRGSANHTFYAFRWARAGGEGRKQMIWMHRVICPPVGGNLPDHINGNGLDNRRDNLRLAAPSENMHNRRRKRNSVSGFKGVSASRSGYWQAGICIDRKSINLGSFDSPEEAARVYDRAARLLHGEFARTNFPAGDEQPARSLDDLKRRGVARNNSSGYRGVARSGSKRGKPWRAQVECKGIRYRIGMFDSVEEAAAAVEQKRTELLNCRT